MPAALAHPWRVIEEREWRRRQDAHARRADALTADHRRRSRDGRTHPVADFLFTYYSLRPAQLRRWHPGVGTALAGAGERLQERWYAPAGDGCVTVDAAALATSRAPTLRFVRTLLAATAGRPAQLGCFGLHEWAMVYRQGGDRRHRSWPLRLGERGTDVVVEQHRIRCTHADAFRFFTAEAAPRNTVRPRREDQVALEQPGCLHATMDLYKWAYKLGPAVSGELLLDCFELAVDVREMDMRASPYDLRELGYQPVPIETADGKAAYVAAQRHFAERAAPLRGRLLEVCDALLHAAGQP